MNKPIRSVKNNYDEIQRAYFLWLCKLVDIGESDQDAANRELASQLHKKEFIAILPNDDNRAADGIKLRQDFADQFLTKDCSCLDGQCTIFEMIVALAMRMAFQISSGQEDNPVGKCFWEMIDNLALRPIDPYDPYLKDKIYELDQKIDIFINRQYRRDGSGGLFPLHNRNMREDQRRVELWYQMHNYIEEKI